MRTLGDMDPLRPAATGRLVFGDDGSAHADTAWRWVRSHDWGRWDIDVLTATPTDSPLWSADCTPEPLPWEPSERRYLGPDQTDPRIRHLSATADPRALLGQATDADLLVVGPRGLGAVRAALLGGTTEWLLHHPPAPLAIVRSGEAVRRALVCVDGSAHSQAALDAFAQLPWSGGVEAVVLGVYDRRSDIDRGFEEAGKVLAGAGIDACTVRGSGTPAPAIIQQIDRRGPRPRGAGHQGLGPVVPAPARLHHRDRRPRHGLLGPGGRRRPPPPSLTVTRPGGRPDARRASPAAIEAGLRRPPLRPARPAPRRGREATPPGRHATAPAGPRDRA